MRVRLMNFRLWSLATAATIFCTTALLSACLYAQDFPASAERLRGTQLLPIDTATQVRIKIWLRKEFPDKQIRRITWRQPMLWEFDEKHRQMAETGKQQAKTWVEEQEQKTQKTKNDIAEYRVRMNGLQPAEKKLRMQILQLIEVNEGLMKIQEKSLAVKNRLLTRSLKKCEWLDELRDAPQVLHRISVDWDAKETKLPREFIFSVTPKEIIRLSESRRKFASPLWLQPVEPRLLTRDLVIRRLQKQQKTGDDWNALAKLANGDLMINSLKLKNSVTPRIAREAVKGTPKERGTVTIEDVAASQQETPKLERPES